MYAQPFYEVGAFWLGLAIGLCLALCGVLFLWLRAWALRRIQYNMAKRVSTNFVVAGEIFRLLRLPHGAEARLTPELMARLTANIEEHASFFAALLQDRESFCLFFGRTFAWAFDDVSQIYSDFVDACAQLELRLSRPASEDESEQADLDRRVKILVSDKDPASDVTYFKLSRAVALIDSVCRPILAERAAQSETAAVEPKLRHLAALLRPV
jgi:hypothetical protein